MKFQKSARVGQCLKLTDDLGDAQGTLHVRFSLTLHCADFYRLCQTDIYVKETTNTSFPQGHLHAACAWVVAPVSERDGVHGHCSQS